VFVNGLNPVIFMEWAEARGMCRDRAAYNHFKALFQIFESGRYYKLYAFHVGNNRYEWLDGTVRMYVHRSLRN